MPKTLVQFPAQNMSLGLDLRSSRGLKLGQISEGSAVRYEAGSGIYTGPGYRSIATPVASVRVDSMKEAAVYPALWIKTGTKVQYKQIDADTFYDSGITVTANKRTAIVEQGNGDIFVTNDTDTNTRFSVGKLASAITASSTSIDLGHADVVAKFAASGNVLIRGDTIAYTGKSGTTLTGVTGIQAGGHRADDIVIQSSNPSTWVEEKGTVAMNYQSRFLIGGVLGTESILYYSSPETADNPEFFYDFDANGSFSKFFPGKLTGLISGLGRGYVFMEKGVHELQGFTDNGILLTVPISETYGAYNPKCVVDMDGVIAFLGQKRLMPITLQLAPDATTAPYLGEDFDGPIRAWLDSHDDSNEQSDDAFLKWDSSQKILKIGALVDGVLEVYGYDAQAKAFFPAESRSLASSSMFQGKSYFGDRDNGKIYEDDTTRTNEGIAIGHSWKTGRMEYEKGRTEMQGKDFAFEGYMSEGCEFTVRAYLEGSPDAAIEWSLDDTLITSNVPVSLGTRGVGVSSIGDGSGGEAFPFKCNLLCRGFSGEDWAFECEMSKEGHFLQWNSFLFRAYLLPRSSRSYE